jgi:CheY-like chemotaxis protein
MRRVLVVDDSALIRNAMVAALEPFGLEIETAEHGEAALAKAAAAAWDLIFLDVVMPVMDGPTALRALRAGGDATPVVLATSVSTAAIVAAAIKLGGVHYIAKPFTPPQIRAVAAKLLRLDPGQLDAPPRVLVQHADPGLPARLRRLLPAHVAIDPSSALAQSLDLAERGPRDLVLLESAELGDELVAIANVIRRALPAAGIFALADPADPAAPWQPDEGLDGWLPRDLDDALARGFLYPNFLRPLVELDGARARLAGFRGPRAHLPAFATQLARRLVARVADLDRTADLRIDARRVSDDPEVVIAVLAAADQALRGAGASPAFVMSAPARAATAGRLDRIVVL